MPSSGALGLYLSNLRPRWCYAWTRSSECARLIVPAFEFMKTVAVQIRRRKIYVVVDNLGTHFMPEVHMITRPSHELLIAATALAAVSAA